MKYSPSTGGFYTPVIHGGAIPADAVAITREEHAFLMDAQSTGKQIVADKKGFPIAIDRPELPIEQQREQVRKMLRGLRDPVLSRVVQIGLVALATGDIDLSDEVFSEPTGVRRKLLDITDVGAIKNGQNSIDMRTAAIAEFNSIAENGSADIKSAFQ